MLFTQSDILHLHDSEGSLKGVFISASLWKKLEPLLNSFQQTQTINTSSNVTKEFSNFLQCWDFRYPYDPGVVCPNCQTAVQDWQKDNTFILHTANIGGLLVFKCSVCGSTIRQKHFKDKRVTEFSR